MTTQTRPWQTFKSHWTAALGLCIVAAASMPARAQPAPRYVTHAELLECKAQDADLAGRTKALQGRAQALDAELRSLAAERGALSRRYNASQQAAYNEALVPIQRRHEELTRDVQPVLQYDWANLVRILARHHEICDHVQERN